MSHGLLSIIVREKRFLVWMAFAVIMIAALSLPSALQSRIGDVSREVVAPLQSGLSIFGSRLREASLAIRGLGGMAAQNREMSQELTRLRNEVRVGRALASENRRLRAALQLRQTYPDELIPSEVVARDITGWWRTVRVAKDSGVEVPVNSTAITADGLVGKVVSSSRNTADILLVSDPTCRVSVRIERVGVSGVLSGVHSLGKGRALCRLDFINKDVEVRVGDEVVTSGLGGIFPKGLLVGRIARVYRGPAGLYQYADVVPSADLSNLNIVFLIEPRLEGF